MGRIINPNMSHHEKFLEDPCEISATANRTPKNAAVMVTALHARIILSTRAKKPSFPR